MPRLFVPPEQISGDVVTIQGADHLHLARVLRARVGDSLLVLDNRGNAFQTTLVTISKTETIARIESCAETASEPPIFVTVAQALGKGDKFEQVLQHGTEAGASAFIPVRAERCGVDIPANRIEERCARWRRIAKGAAEQSGRARIPEVAAPLSFIEMLRTANQTSPHPPPCEGGGDAGFSPSRRESGNNVSSPYEGEGQGGVSLFLLHPEGEPLARALRGLPDRPARLLLAIGPEGGWSPAEVSAAQMANLRPATLGPRILRTETAALVALSQILYHFENLTLDGR